MYYVLYNPTIRKTYADHAGRTHKIRDEQTAYNYASVLSGFHVCMPVWFCGMSYDQQIQQEAMEALGGSVSAPISAQWKVAA